MSEENKTKHRQYSDAHRRAALKYRRERAQIVITTSKENKEKIKQAAAVAGLSVNQFIIEKVLKSL